jgi:subtilase family serine protease
VYNIQRAFHITLRTYAHPSEAREFYAPDVEPSVDASLPIADISGLNNYVLPHPKSLRTDSSTSRANPVPRSGSGPSGAFMGSDFRAAYLPEVALTGAGQMVGLVEFDGYYASDISAYETAAGLPAVPLQNVLVDGYDGVPTPGPNSGSQEVSLDIEMAICMAPGLSEIVVFEAPPSGLANDLLNAMAAHNQVGQLSCSWGWGGGPSTTTDNIFKQMAAQGQSFFTASGDTDAFTAGPDSVNGVDNPALNNTPSSCPYITVVGGTTLTTSGPSGSWSSETVWNWGFHNDRYVGSSGGVSSHYSIPSWQTAIDMSLNGGSTAYRNIPDVALTADNVYVEYGNGRSGAVGGTSCAAPLWAGLSALMNQQALAAGRPPIGFINPAIYALGKGAGYKSAFHDITTGNNTSANSPNEFYAVAGYDLCTGWGTPAGKSLIDAIAGLPDTLGISPATGFTTTGTPGGPFSTSATNFQLTNAGTTSLTWSLIVTSSWITASTTSGTLTAGGSANLVVSLTASAKDLAVGTYLANLEFTNWNSHIAQIAAVTLNVVPSLVQNGAFETGDFTGWSLVGNAVVPTPFGTTVYNAVESSTDYPLVVHSGSYGAFLGDTHLATLSQTLPTVPGENYLLSFWLDNPTNGTVQQFRVNWNIGGVTNTLFSLFSPPAFAWTNLQFIVTATGINTVLQFAAENDPAYFGVDDVSVTHIPGLAFQALSMSGNGFNLTWPTAEGLLYLVQYKTNLLQPNWVDLGKPVTASSSTLSVTDAGLSPQRFYRVLAWP